MARVPDNYDAWVWHDRDIEARLDKLPRCEICGEPIQQWDAVRIGRLWYCDDCLRDAREDTTEDSW